MIAALLLGLAARQAADRRVTALADLQQALDAVIKTAEEGDAYGAIQARNSFHLTLAQITCSRVLETTIGNLRVHLLRNKLVTTTEQRIGCIVQSSGKSMQGTPIGRKPKPSRMSAR